MTLADRIVVMRGGVIEQVGSPLDIYRDPASRFVADFFGSPSMNLIAGAVRRSNGGPVFEGAGVSLPLPLPFAGAREGACTLGVRPEHLEISNGGGALQCEIGLVEPLGKDTLLYFEHGAERPTIAVVEGSARFREGERMGLHIPPEALYLFDEEGKRVRPSGG